MVADQICSCSKKMYGYTDGAHKIFVCYNCGRYSGLTGGDSEFLDFIMRDPLIILSLIKEQLLIPIKWLECFLISIAENVFKSLESGTVKFFILSIVSPC